MNMDSFMMSVFFFKLLKGESKEGGKKDIVMRLKENSVQKGVR